MSNQNSAKENKHRPEELLAKYNIKKNTYYARLKFLGIKASKDAKGLSYLTDEQLVQFDALHHHINVTGKMEGFDNTALVQSDDSQIEEATEEINLHNHKVNNEDEYAALLRSAQEYVAGLELAKIALVKEIQENPELMPEDLRTQLEEAKKAVSPKSQSPQNLANNILAQFRGQKNIA